MDSRNLNLVSRPISELFGDNPELLYVMPKFQREYVWKEKDWMQFFSDLTLDENGHFLGTIIGIEPQSAFEKNPQVIVIDGQQRLTTISLYLAALYSHIRFYKANLNEDQNSDFTTLKRRLVQKAPGKLLRVIPQSQHNNFIDYQWLLGEIDVTVEKFEKPLNVENRRIYKAYRYFHREIQKLIKIENNDKIAMLFNLVDKVMAAILVVITVKSYSDAFQLFESLNNRGQNLTKTDLLKNIVLSKVSEDVQIDDYYYSKWTQIIENIGDSDSEQDRFFRNNYNAFRLELNKGDVTYPIAKSATKSNLLDIYAELMNDKPKEKLELFCANSYLHAKITLRKKEGISRKLSLALLHLGKADGTTSYVLILYLMKYMERLQISEDDIISVINALISFQVKRNMTKYPPTNKMIPFFNNLIQEIDEGEYVGKKLVVTIIDRVRSFSAPDDLFRNSLREDVYITNKETTTLMLKMLAYQGMTAEDERDLWKENEGNPVWTIEHILPQGANLIPEWIEMIADGDEQKASEIQKAYVHTLGNLTITGFNSNLSNRPFQEKKNKKNAEGKYIGYMNGLNLNADVCDKEYWNKDTIQQRTDTLVEKIIQLFTI